MQALPALDYLRATDAKHAAQLASGGARFIAGGTDLVPNMRRGLQPAHALVDIARVPELQHVTLLEDGSLAIGAGVTLARIAANALVAQRVPALAQAAASVAGPQHRAAGTLGGNLCQDTRCIFYNQGPWWRESNGCCLKFRGATCHVAPQGDRCHAAFCSDLAPVLVAARARARIAGAGGSRTVDLEAMYRDDGAAHLALARGELLVRIAVPPVPGALVFGKLRQRGGMDFPLASIAIALHAGRARVALGGTGSAPAVFEIEADAADAAVRAAVLRHASCMRTTSTPANYRRDAAAALAVRLLAQARNAREAAE